MTSWFSGVAREYAAFRPHYPRALFAALARFAPQRALAWDCGCGNGQASVEVAAHFGHVVATDISAQQLAAAEPHDRVEYRVASAEQSGLADASVGLVTVAQALHWFDIDAFHDEVRRVLVRGGVIAEWAYPLLEVPDVPAITELVKEMSASMRAWWPPERDHIETGYRDLPFPFEPVSLDVFPPEAMAMTATWTPDQMIGYVSTWSAISSYRKKNPDNPIDGFSARLREVWGSAASHDIRWPLILRVGRT